MAPHLYFGPQQWACHGNLSPGPASGCWPWMLLQAQEGAANATHFGAV